MIKKLKSYADRCRKQLGETAKQTRDKARSWLKQVWASHQERANTNTAYVAALGAAACAVAKLVTQDPALLAVVAALVAVYVAIHHATTPDPWRPSSSRWDDDGLSWR